MASENISVSSHLIGRSVKGLSDTPYADLNTWPTINEGALDEVRRTCYLCRKKAVVMYLSGCSGADIYKECGIGLKHVQRLIKERCIQVHHDGLIYGWRGLVPYLHIKPYIRTKVLIVDSVSRGAAGCMQTVLSLHPELRIGLEKKILTLPHTNELGEIKKSTVLLLKWFLTELRKLGYEQRKLWPFTTKLNGYYAVYRYQKKVLLDNPKKAARILGNPDIEQKLISGDGVDRPVNKVFQRVEMDAHKLDGRFCVMMPQLSGGYFPKLIHRIWIIVIQEVYSRAVLGYYISMGREVSKEDVIRAIKSALSRWHRKTLTFNDVAYNEEAALPSGMSNTFLGVCWDETSVDGALAECCKTVETILHDVVGSKLITPARGFSSRHSKDDRPFIESFFRTLGTHGLQRLSNTTGANPKDNKGWNPENIAVTSQFQLEYLEELLDVLIANYNARPHSSLGYRSPLQYLNYLCSENHEVLRYVDQKSVESLLSYGKKCKVHGGIKSGRKPYVNFSNARYTNEILGQRFDLVGQYIWVVNHYEDDARVAMASTLDGMELGVLRAGPPWHKLPHSLRVRSAIISAIDRRMFTIANSADAIEAFLDYCHSQANNKLPVHPAYLEAIRILEKQALLNQTDTILKQALEESSQVNLKSSENTQSADSEQAESHDSELPARRMAAD